MTRFLSRTAVGLFTLPLTVMGQKWAPLLLDNVAILPVAGRSDVNPWGWGDSYSVGSSCYCSTTYDHDIDVIVVSTPLGARTVRQVCELLGPGPGIEGRPRYNDIQCGNGPANDAGDEDTCPGRIEHGKAGCGYIGPKWNFTAIVVPTKAPVAAAVPTPIRSPVTVPVAAPVPVPAPVPVTVPVPVSVKAPMPLSVTVSTPVQAAASVPVPSSGVFIEAAKTSGPSFSLSGSSGFFTSPVGTIAAGISRYDASLFRSHRWSSSSGFTYTVTGLVPGAPYWATFGFAETYEPNCAVGQRILTVTSNGIPVISNLDVFAVAGACKRAYTNGQTVMADATGKIDLGFVKVKENPFVSFIHLIPKK